MHDDCTLRIIMNIKGRMKENNVGKLMISCMVGNTKIDKTIFQQ